MAVYQKTSRETANVHRRITHLVKFPLRSIAPSTFDKELNPSMISNIVLLAIWRAPPTVSKAGKDMLVSLLLLIKTTEPWGPVEVRFDALKFVK